MSKDIEPISDFWKRPATIERNHFVAKSLSCWSLNIAVGCTHGCRFCYVPDVSTNKMGDALGKLGVSDPDEEWGRYVFLRPWQELTFLASLRRAEALPAGELNADGNRAVMLCTTTDPYMVIKNADKRRQRALNVAREFVVRRALRLILEESTLNVRILTRSPLAREDFGLMMRLAEQNRIVFGMSLPTLDEHLSRIYEPHAPSPRRRLETLRMAKAKGIPVFVAMAPTYPECDLADMTHTLAEIAELDPITVYHEPINIRAENVERIAAHARELGIEAKTEVFRTPDAWAQYAISQLLDVTHIARDFDLAERLHLWPDKALGSYVKRMSDPIAREAMKAWLGTCWARVSEWPGKKGNEPRMTQMGRMGKQARV